MTAATPHARDDRGVRRALAVARAGWGAALVVAPRRTAVLLGARADDRAAVAASRVLGVRHLVQALVTGRGPGRGALAGGAAVDAAHALSLVALAAVDRRRARPALTDAGVALAWALLSLLAARRPRRR